MEQFSEENIRANCPHCDPTSHAFEYPLEETDNFYILCDANALEKGHLLIIPKAHVASIAQYNPADYKEFLVLYKKVAGFVLAQYGSVAVFEHGKFGQTVFHSHVHFLPFTGGPADIVPEGDGKLMRLRDLADLKFVFEHDGGYLFFAIGDTMWTVNKSLVAPRFFRDRFASALGVPERGNWKAMRQNPETMRTVTRMNAAVQAKWRANKK